LSAVVLRVRARGDPAAEGMRAEEVAMTVSMLELPVTPATGRCSYVRNGEDVALVASGTALEQAFEAAAEAAFALMGDTDRVRPERTLPVSFIEGDEALALVRWLELLIEAAGEHDMLFSEFHLQREHARWWGCATGGRRRLPLRCALRVRRAGREVKRVPGGWEASCVVRAVEPPGSVTRAVERSAGEAVEVPRGRG
jgi:SHS2 domain-containing protein